MTARPGALLAVALAAVTSPAAPARSDRACTCACSGLPSGQHPFRRPSPEAFRLNREGREMYRQRRWPEARALYQAAGVADPSFLGPLLNLACAHAQEGNFAQAVSAASELAGRAYVPWADEIRQAADLAPLAARPEGKKLQEALAAAGRRWGAALDEALLFVARRGPPVRLPAAGVLHLGLEQEILAWLPGSGRYRQVTAEQGGVLGFVRSRDGHTVDYVRAGRLVREPGRPDRLRALTLRRLDLPSMAVGPAVELSGDIVRLQVQPPDSGRTIVVVAGLEGSRAWRFDGRALLPAAAGSTPGPQTLQLTAAGVQPPAVEAMDRPCAYRARDVSPSSGPPAVQIRRPGRAAFLLEAPFGAGLQGLPFP